MNRKVFCIVAKILRNAHAHHKQQSVVLHLKWEGKAVPKKNTIDVIIGSYGTKEASTIHWLTFDITNGMFHEVMAIDGLENPSFLTLNKDLTRLYAISEVEEGKVHSFRVNHQSKSIQLLNTKPTYGAPCYVMVDSDEQYVFSANYGGGSIVTHHLQNDGSLGRSADCKVHGNMQSNVSNIHTIRQVRDTNYYIATDLGQDRLYVYIQSDNGSMKLHRTIEMPSGSGPRHIDFHPALNRMYVVSEFHWRVYTFQYDHDWNHIDCIQSTPTLPDNFKGDNYGADIHVTSQGDFLFTSNRGHHSLTSFRIKKDGTIEPLAYTPTLGEWPRNFAILPNSPYIIVANEHTNNIVGMVMKENGNLEQVTLPYTIQQPVCIQTLK